MHINLYVATIVLLLNKTNYSNCCKSGTPPQPSDTAVALSVLVGQHVFSHVQSGVDNVHSAMTILQNGQVNINANIEAASMYFTSAERQLGNDIKAVETSQLDLVNTISIKESRIHKLRRDETSLTANLAELERSLNNQRQRINDASNGVRNSEYAVREAQHKHDEACKAKRDMDIANAATAWIPIVNLFTIPILTSISLTTLKSAIDDRMGSLNSARSHLSTAESTLSSLQDSKHRKENELSGLRSQKASLELDLVTSNDDLQNMKYQYIQKVDILEKVRTCMTRVSKVSARAKFLKDESCSKISKYDVSILRLPFMELVDGIKNIPGYSNPNLALWDGILSSDKFRAIADSSDYWV